MTNPNTSIPARIASPEASEYAPFYETYVALVPDGDIVRTLEGQGPETAALWVGLSEQQAEYRYAPEKWSAKEMLGHVTDSERILSYRILRIARSDQTPIEGFEQDDYVRAAEFGGRPLTGLVEEFTAVRRATLLLLGSLAPEAWLRRGTANQNEVSVRALAYMIAGHELHHRQVLQERYLTPAARP